MPERQFAPAVSYPLGRSTGLAARLAALWCASAALVAYALFWPPALDWPALAATIMIVSVFGSGAALWRFWCNQRRQELCWSGESWLLRSGDVSELTGTVEVRLDLQRAALLRFQPAAGRGAWCWAEAAAAPQHWHLLRCALYSSAAASSHEDRDAAAGRA